MWCQGSCCLYYTLYYTNLVTYMGGLVVSSTILNLVAYMGGHNSGRLLGQFKIGRKDDEEQKWGTRRKEQGEREIWLCVLK